ARNQRPIRSRSASQTGFGRDFQSKCAAFCEQHGSSNGAREICELHRRHGRDRCSAVGGNAGGIGRGPAQARTRPAAGLGGGGAAQRGAWESAAPELGQSAGIFTKHGITLDLVYTRDGEVEPSVTSGSTDVGVGVGTIGVLRAYAKGAPVRVIGANTTGTANY